jgi:hypothetical protein
MADMPPSRLVLAWREADTNPLVRSFADITADNYRSPSLAAQGPAGSPG